MPAEYTVVLDRMPPKLSGYLRSVILPRRRFQPGDALPQLNVARRGFKIDENHLARFRTMCGWASSNDLPFVYPLTLAFHYHLSVFAHPAFPWSLRTLLGIRNLVVQHRQILIGENLDLDVRTLGLRFRPKGIEFDIYTRLVSDSQMVWESVHVYYLRGNRNAQTAQPVSDHLPVFDACDFEVRWDAPRSGGWKFARLTGDFNPMHYFAPWARRLGFKRDFCHTQRLIADCVQRLPDARQLLDRPSLRLDAAFKGPVYYGSQLVMRGVTTTTGCRFNLYSNGADKPALPGNIQEVNPDYDLFGDWM